MAIALIIATFTASPATAAAQRDTFDKYNGVLPDQYYDALARCESGGNWKHSTRSYTGGLGIYRGTWQRWSDSTSAKGKTPAQQVKVADAIAFKSHINPDGTKVWRVGPWGWGCVKGQKSLQAYICKSRHKDVARWRHGCATVRKSK